LLPLGMQSYKRHALSVDLRRLAIKNQLDVRKFACLSASREPYLIERQCA
jgi:hypothetical protein